MSGAAAQAQDFPKMMRHPAERAAVSTGEPRWIPDANGHRTLVSGQGKPAQNLPVLVHTADDQEYYESRGYTVAGKVSAEQFARMAPNPGSPPAEDFQEYPKWVDGTLCADADEERATRLAKGLAPMPGGGAAHAREQAPEQAENAASQADESPLLISLRFQRSEVVKRLDDCNRQMAELKALREQLETVLVSTDAQIAELTAPPEIIPAPVPRRKRGRPPGSKTRNSKAMVAGQRAAAAADKAIG